MLGNGGFAQAQKRGHIFTASDLQLTKLFCAIRDGNFVTFFEFKVQTVTDHPELTGEISNYQVQLNGTRKYLSGILFTSISYNNLKVTGDTGDPADAARVRWSGELLVRPSIESRAGFEGVLSGDIRKVILGVSGLGTRGSELGSTRHTERRPL